MSPITLLFSNLLNNPPLPEAALHAPEWGVKNAYSVIALAPNAPAIAEATAMITFRIVSQTDFLTAITLYTSFLLLVRCKGKAGGGGNVRI